MAISQNGWEALPVGSPKLHKWVIPGTGRHLILREGSAGFLIAFYAHWYHKNVEALDMGPWDEWGHAVRPIRGTTGTVSNHESGTAGDLNATRHPLGVAVTRTFTRAQRRRIRLKLRTTMAGRIRWGGDYKTRPDGMHVEIIMGLAACERLARILMHTPRGRKILKANRGQRAVIKS